LVVLELVNYRSSAAKLYWQLRPYVSMRSKLTRRGYQVVFETTCAKTDTSNQLFNYFENWPSRLLQELNKAK
jgi:hypothetical protein